MSKKLVETLGTLERRIKQERRILVVDDSPLDREILSCLLKDLGCVCWEASSCHEAIEVIQNKGPFDVCLLDIRMPGVDGLRCAPCLKEADPKIRIVLCTGYPNHVDLLKLESLRSIGVVTLLLKPTCTEDLQRMFREFNL